MASVSVMVLLCSSSFEATAGQGEMAARTGESAQAVLKQESPAAVPVAGATDDHGSRTIPTLSKIWPSDNKVTVSGMCHVLLFYGLNSCDLPSIPSGAVALKALTDEDAATSFFGTSPFIRTRNGLRYFLSEDPIFHTRVGESHRDQCLATFAALNLPLNTPIHLKAENYSISNLLAESVANFSFDQHEPAWTAMAYAKYLPPRKEWTNRFGERFSFSLIAQNLLHVDPKKQSCAGTHIFQALVAIEKADRRSPLLDANSRKQVDDMLTATLREVGQRQQEDGCWNQQWSAWSDRGSPGPETLEYRVLVTGHLLEILNGLDTDRRPSNTVLMRAAEWLGKSLNSDDLHSDGSLVCPFTHAARTARAILEPVPGG